MTALHANARNGAIHNEFMANVRGKPEAFTDKENRAMRFILRGQYEHLQKIGKVKNQTQMGKLIGVGQQTAGKLLGPKAHGFSRPTALKLAELCGFDSPETMLKELGALADPDAAPSGWAMRDLAVRSARALGYDEDVIDLVVARHSEDRFAQAPSRWWVERIVRAQADRDAERDLMPPSSPSGSLKAAAVEPPAPKRSRGRRTA